MINTKIAITNMSDIIVFSHTHVLILNISKMIENLETLILF